MAEFITSKRKSDMTAGERRVADRLQSLLGDDCIIWYDIPIGRKRLHPDFIVLIPSRGLLVLEVKDWKLATIKKLDPETVTIETSSGEIKKTHPVMQARNSIFPVINIMESDELLQQSMKSKHQGKICFPYSYGAVFTNITRNQFHTAIPAEMRETLLPDRYLVCQNDIAPSATAASMQKLLLDMFDYQYGKPLTDKQIDRIRWHIFPEIHIQADVFFDSGSDTEQIDDKALAIAEKKARYKAPQAAAKVMDLKQEQLARSLGDGHRVIHGVAGSGKTIILYYRCRQLAQLMKKTILVLCFNITLARKLQASIEQRGIKNVEVNNFNAWCPSQLKKHNIHYKEDKTQKPWEQHVTDMIKAVDEGKIPPGQYGAILIDEGHDFEPEWLRLVVKMLDPTINSLLLLYDDAQSIYKKKSGLNFTLKSVGINARGRTTILKNNYRNTREILQFAYQFAKNHFPESKSSDIPVIVPEAAGESGEEPVLTKCRTPDHEIQNTLQLLHKLHKQGKQWQDIAIISPTKATLKEIEEKLDEQKLPCQSLNSRKNKRDYQPHADKITLITTASSKGLEFDTAIIVNASFTFTGNKDKESDEDEANEEHRLEESIRRLYVAMTRAQKNLFVSYWEKNELSELIEAANGVCFGS